MQELAQGFRPTTTYDPAIKQAQAVEFIAYAVGELLKETRQLRAAVEAAAKAPAGAAVPGALGGGRRAVQRTSEDREGAAPCAIRIRARWLGGPTEDGTGRMPP